MSKDKFTNVEIEDGTVRLKPLSFRRASQINSTDLKPHEIYDLIADLAADDASKALIEEATIPEFTLIAETVMSTNSSGITPGK